MKLTAEDIKKYGTEKEIKLLNEMGGYRFPGGDEFSDEEIEEFRSDQKAEMNMTPDDFEGLKDDFNTMADEEGLEAAIAKFGVDYNKTTRIAIMKIAHKYVDDMIKQIQVYKT